MAGDTVQINTKQMPDRSHYEDYWCEYHSIKRTTEFVGDVYDFDDGCKSDDELENETEWLIETGFDFLIQYIKEGQEETTDEDYVDVMSTLTPKQAAVVKKRIATLKGTVHQKSQRSPPDVRNVFSKFDSTTASITQGSAGFHCHIRKDNRTEITINTESDMQKSDSNTPVDIPVPMERTQFVYEKNVSSVDHGHNGSNGESNTVQNRLETSNARKDDMKRNSFPEMASIISGHKQDYNIKNQHLHSTCRIPVQCDNQNFQEKFTYNSEFHPSALPTVELKDQASSPSQESEPEPFKMSVNSLNEDSLPELVPKEDDRGVTTVTDLSPEDMVKVRQLALIELTTLFDVYNISYTRRKNVKKRHKGSVFGASLETVVNHDSKHDPYCKVPKLITMLISQINNVGLEEKGILRVPGSFAKIESLRSKVESYYFSSPELVQRAINNSSARDCAALLKNFIRDLSEPILTNSSVEAFLKVQNIPDIVLQIKALNLLILALPEIHRDTLCFIISFLDRVIANEHHNSMGLHNVAMIMAPNFFLPTHKKNCFHSSLEEKANQSHIEDEMNFARNSCQIAKLLIQYWNLLWMIPPFLLKQVRVRNESIRHKRVNKDLKHRKKKLAGKVLPQENDLKSTKKATVTLIKVSTPIPKVGIFCPINNDTLRAGDVVMSVINEIQANPQNYKLTTSKNRPRPNSDVHYNTSRPCMLIASDKLVFVDTHSLYEVGGNIGWRKLHHGANVSAVLRENPLAEWVVKCNHVQ